MGSSLASSPGAAGSSPTRCGISTSLRSVLVRRAQRQTEPGVLRLRRCLITLLAENPRPHDALPQFPAGGRHIARTGKNLGVRQTYLLDNVTTSGNTLAAARAALGFGAGLVFADASNHATVKQPSFL